MMAPYRVLVVDDSAFMRKIVSDLILQDSQFIIVATAKNGKEAVEAVKVYKPDAVTLDLEMPEMNGLEALQEIMRTHPTPVIMLSGISEDHTRETIKALQYGAFDFIHKPSSAISNDIRQVGAQLLEKLNIAVLTQRHRLKSSIIKRQEPELPIPPPKKPDRTPSLDPAKQNKPKQRPSPAEQQEKAGTPNILHKTTNEKASRLNVSNKLEAAASAKSANAAKDYEVTALHAGKATLGEKATQRKQPISNTFSHLVAIGTSTGGPRALHEVISSLPGDLPAPVLVVQHMPPKFTKSLAQRLDSFSELQVVEAAHGEKLKAGVVYIAPGGYHMELSKDADGYAIALTQQPPRNGHRPSVDILFESLTPFPELRRHAVIMTGMGSDGTKGLKLLMESGGESAIAEAEETCIVYGMPRAAIESGCVKHIVPLPGIAAHIVNAVKK